MDHHTGIGVSTFQDYGKNKTPTFLTDQYQRYSVFQGSSWVHLGTQGVLREEGQQIFLGKEEEGQSHRL